MEMMIIIFIIVLLYQFIFNRNKPYIHKNVSSDRFINYFRTLSISFNQTYMLLNPANSEIKLQYMLIREDEKWRIELYLLKVEWSEKYYDIIRKLLEVNNVTYSEKISIDDGITPYLEINLQTDLDLCVTLTIKILTLLNIDPKKKYLIRYGNISV